MLALYCSWSEVNYLTFNREDNYLGGRIRRRRPKIKHIVGASNHEVRCLKRVGKKLHGAPNYRLRVRWAVHGVSAVHSAETSPERLNAGHMACDLDLLSACGYVSPASIWQEWTPDMMWKTSLIRCKIILCNMRVDMTRTVWWMSVIYNVLHTASFCPLCLCVNSNTLALLRLMF